MDVPLDQDVEDREGEVGQELPDLPGQQHPQDAVGGVDPDPAPAHRHLGRIVADLVQAHGCNGDDQRNAPARQTKQKKPLRIEHNFLKKLNFPSLNTVEQFECKCVSRSANM